MSLLPEGYKRLLYIESTGTQWIDTGFVPTATAKVVAEVQYANVATAQYSGLYSGSYMIFGVASSKWEVYLGNKALATTTTATAKRTTVVLDAVNKCAVNDGVSTAAAYTSFGTASLTMPIFVLREGANSFRNYSSMKLFSYKIYNGTVLVRNFIPCINDAGEIGLYETVNGVFCGNSGTGVFVAGPEFWYDELEYIESSGTQYADTGFIPNQDSRVDITAMRLDSSTSSFIPYGAAESYQSNAFECYDSGSQLEFNYDGQYNTTIGSSTVGEIVTLSHDKNKISVNGELLHTFTYTSFTAPYTLILFGIHRAVSAYGKARIYSCQIYDNGTLIRDFIPAKLPDGSIGLIDKLTEEFYPNMGTGVFTAGKVKPTRYMELEYIESTGTQYIDTGFKPNQNSRIKLTVMPVSLSSSTASWWYGVRKASAVDAFGVMTSGTTSMTTWFGTKSKVTTVSNLLQKITIDQNKTETTVTYSNGDVNIITNTSETFTSEYNLFLYTINLAGTPASASLSGKIYSCQICDNGTLTRDYIPIKLYDGTVGLLDKVSGCFYGNAGTDTFVAGPELYGLDENTVLLLHGEDIADSSDYRNAITNNGVTVSAGQSKFGGKALRFDGSSWLSLAGSIAEFGLGDFTIDFWIYPEALSKDHFYFSGDVTGAFFFGKVGSESAKRIGIGRANLAWDGYFGAGTTDNVWNHVALVRKDGTYSLYINGALNATTANSFAVTMAGGPLLIGSQGATYNYSIKGYMDEFRLSNVARWSGNFAVQNKPYSAIVKMPPVPADLEYSVADSTVTLTWTGSEFAAGYNVYRNGELVATVTDTAYSEEIQPSIGYTYEVTAFNDFGETEPALVEVAPSAAPPAPANLRVMFADFASAQIAWDASVGATAYRVYRDGEFLAETESRIFADSGLSKDTEYVYTVTAINVVGESSASSLTVKTSDFTLITDRTAADVEFALAQALNPDRNNTEWLKGLKGTYNATDLNRVEKAVEYVANRLEIAGWRRKPAVKIDWSFSDFPTVSEMQRYLDNIRLLRAALPEGMPAVPADMNGFTYIEANTIEQILLMLDAAVTNIMLNIYYSNEKYSGEVK